MQYSELQSAHLTMASIEPELQDDAKRAHVALMQAAAELDTDHMRHRANGPRLAARLRQDASEKLRTAGIMDTVISSLLSMLLPFFIRWLVNYLNGLLSHATGDGAYGAASESLKGLAMEAGAV